MELRTRRAPPRKAEAAVPAAVARHAEERGSAPAIVFRGESMSYRALHARMVELQSELRRFGVNHGDRVILALDRGPDLIAGLLAVARAGATYVPVDPAHPPSRIEAVTAQAAPRVGLADALGAAVLPAKLQVARTDVPPEPVKVAPRAVAAFAEAAAYMLFTSGSTGRPKGVVIPHRAVEAFLRAIAARLDITAKDRILAATTIGFDISVLEILLPLWLGGTVDLVDEATRAHPGRLRAHLESNPITVAQATPTGFRLLITAGWKGTEKLKILCGGEAMSPELASALLERGDEVWNLYGPTECTVWATAHRLQRRAPTPFLGEPLDGTGLRILGPDGNPADDGELVISGDQVGTGYFRDAVKTDAAFIGDPDGPEGLTYRTGDRVERTKKGLVFKGRLDSQVKVRGVRIELGEVESVLDAHPAVVSCAVVHDAAKDELLAYAMAKAGTPPPTADEMGAFLAPKLYSAARPSRWVWLDEMPLTATGKVDRNALPEIEPESASKADGEAPANDIEWLVAKAWSQVLGLPQAPSRQASFLDLGGTSIKALETVLRLESWLDVKIPTAAFTARPTVAAQAALLQEDLGEDAALDAVRLASGDETPAVFALCGIHLYAELAAALEGRTVYGVSVQLERDLYSPSKDPPSVEAIAEQAEAAVRAVAPHGPYCLAGASFAGLVAYELAHRLTRAGEQVEGVIVLDTVLPNAVHAGLARRVGLGFREIWQRVAAGLNKNARANEDAPRRPQDFWSEASDQSVERYLASTRARAPIRLLAIRASRRGEGRGVHVDPDLGWSRLLDHVPEVVEVSGDHLGILKNEGALQCAEAIQSFLGRASRGDSDLGAAA